jgi:hypothetical protein
MVQHQGYRKDPETGIRLPSQARKFLSSKLARLEQLPAHSPGLERTVGEIHAVHSLRNSVPGITPQGFGMSLSFTA